MSFQLFLQVAFVHMCNIILHVSIYIYLFVNCSSDQGVSKLIPIFSDIVEKISCRKEYIEQTNDLYIPQPPFDVLL